MLLALGACGGSAAMPLDAEPPSSSPQGGPAPTITVEGARPIVIGGPPASRCGGKDDADCAAAKLQDAAGAAQAAAKADPTFAVPHAGSADTVVGVGSLTASSQRLGADLRNATKLPQRPVPPPPTTPFPRHP
jgi:hypothetical protein